MPDGPACCNNPKGNADTERFMRTLKEELTWLREWPSQTSLIAALDAWIRHYNAAYLHSSLGYKPPETFEQNYFTNHSPTPSYFSLANWGALHSAGALSQHGPLELGEGTNNLHHHPPGGGVLGQKSTGSGDSLTDYLTLPGYGQGMLYPFSRFLFPARLRSNCGPAARKKRGFNLIEAAIVLGVVGLVIGGIWVAAASVSRSMRVRQTFDGLMFIAQKMNQLYGKTYVDMFPAGVSINAFHGQLASYSPVGYLTPLEFSAMNMLPANWRLQSNVLYGPSITMSPVSGYVPAWFYSKQGSSEFGWSIDLWGTVPNVSDCQALAAYVFGSLGKNTIIYAGVGGTGGTYAEALLDNGAWSWWKNGSSGSGLPDPFLAKNVTECNSFEIMVSRP